MHFDCHAHVFGTVPAIPDPRYMPGAPARLATWLGHLERHGLRGGVLVQVSFMGTDNARLCAALAPLDRSRFAGVAVVPPEAGDAELDRLVAVGVRGLRWNLVRGATMPDLASRPVQALLARMRARRLHLEIHLEGPRLARWLPELADHGTDIVIDHFGLPSEPEPRDDPLVRALADQRDRANIFLKFSAPYRTRFDLAPFARAFLALVGADRIVWGSDWPHTQHEREDFGKAVRAGKQMAAAIGERAVYRLYGLGQAESGA